MTTADRGCVACGQPIASNARFCPSCGAGQPALAAPVAAPDSANPPDLSYSTYRQLIFRVAHSVRRLRDIADSLADDEARPLADLLQLIEASHFSIAVVGEFKRGKSTFINALLGDEVLPADIEPCSATLNRVTYGLKPGARIVFRAEGPHQGERVETIPIERLADYVTKLTPESATMSALVKEAVIAYPVPFCKNNVDIIDTPGLNDDPVMTEVTFHVLSTVHAAIMVIMANAPFGESEQTFLREVLLKEHTSVMFVVTAIDRIRREADRKRVLEAIRQRITQAIEQHAELTYGGGTAEHTAYLRRMGAPMIFGLSGYQALQGRRERDAELFASSGFPEFEIALEQFLTQERGARSMIDLIERVLQSGGKIRSQIDITRSQKIASEQQRSAAFQSAHHHYGELRAQSKATLDHTVSTAISGPLITAAHSRIEVVETQLKISAGGIIEHEPISADNLSAALKESIGDAVGNTGQALLDRLPQGQAQETGKRYVEKVAGWISRQGSGAASPGPASSPIRPDTARHRLTVMLPDKINAALAQVWKSLLGSTHMEVQRALQDSYLQLRAIATAIGQQITQTATQFDLTVPAIDLDRQFDQMLIQMPPESGVWAAPDATSARVGPTLTTLKPTLQRAAEAVHVRVGVLMLRAPEVDQFKGQLIRSTADQITQHIHPKIAEIQQAIIHDIDMSFRAIAGVAYQIFEAAFAHQEALLNEIRQHHERATIVNEMAINELTKQQLEVDHLCADARRLVRDLAGQS